MAEQRIPRAKRTKRPTRPVEEPSEVELPVNDVPTYDEDDDALEEDSPQSDKAFTDALISRMAKELGVDASRVVSAMREATKPEEKQAVRYFKDGKWIRASPEEEKRIKAGELNLTEWEEQGDPNLLNLGPGFRRGENADFHYRWAHIKPEYRTREMGMHYEFVTESPDGRHPVRNVPGIGPVVSVGDLVLMRTWKPIAERRQQQADIERLREQANRMRDVQEDFRQKAAEHGDDVELFEEEFGTKIAHDYDLERRGTTGDYEPEYAELAAAALLRARNGISQEEALERATHGRTRKAQFAGFSGPAAAFETTMDRRNRERGLRTG